MFQLSQFCGSQLLPPVGVRSFCRFCKCASVHAVSVANLKLFGEVAVKPSLCTSGSVGFLLSLCIVQIYILALKL